MTKAPCSCHKFASPKSIEDALGDTSASNQKTQNLIDWLSGRLENQERPCGGKCCVKRGKTSLLVLNEIRDACRPFLEGNIKVSSKDSAVVHNHKDEAPKTEPYEEAFPSLSKAASPSVSKSKQKRRIRPATVSTSIATWGLTKGNLIDVPSTSEPLVVTTPRATKEAISESRRAEAPPTRAAHAAPTPIATSPVRGKVEVVESEEQLVKVPELSNLINVYCTLLQSCLVPSTAQELHLLVRLLTTNSTISPQHSTTFARIFSSPLRCRYFAAQSLAKLNGVVLGFIGPSVVLTDVIRCPPICTHCPELVRILDHALQQYTIAARRQGAQMVTSHLTSSQVPLLTVPFNHSRDSRHNYKTRDEQAVFKNREETRDAFLYQLRTFLSIKGKVVDKGQRMLRDLKLASRDVVVHLIEANLGWFSEFFCDLLLQIGLVPLEETDGDLLKIANQEKLQKLHSRFSSKNPKTTQSTRKLADGPKTDSSSPEVEAQRHFPGHQEFFYMFLLATDSHRLASHLTAKLVSTLREFSTTLSPTDIEKRSLEMCLIARFLGVLAFSPNWQSTSFSRVYGRSGYCGVDQLAAVGISPVEMIRTAWATHRLIAVVPWVVDMLKLSMRDPITRESRTYQETVGLLRDIQLTISSVTEVECSIEKPVLVLVKLSLETFFDEVVGISHSHTPVEVPALCDIRTDISQGIDGAFVEFGRPTLFAFNSHVEELSVQLSSADFISVRSPGASRKLRPLILSTVDSPPPPEALDTSNLQTSFRFSLTGNKDDPVRAKLQDTFFHQHPELKEVCEFAAGRALKVALSQLSTDIPRHLTEDEVHASYRSYVENHVKARIEQTMDALIAHPLDSKVAEIAISLAVVRALRSSDAILKAKAAEQCERSRVAAEETIKQGSKGRPIGSSKGAATESLRALTDAIHVLLSEIAKSVDAVFCVSVASLSAVLCCIEGIKSQINHQIPEDAELRSFYQSVLWLNHRSQVVIDWALLSSSEETAQRWCVLHNFLRIVIQIKSLSAHGLRKASEKISVIQSIRSLVEIGLDANSEALLATLLDDMVNARLVRIETMKHVLTQLDGSKDGKIHDFISSFVNSLETSDTLVPL